RILRLAQFDKLSEHAGASQLLRKAALPPSTELLSRFIFWVAWISFILIGASVLGIGVLQEHISHFFGFLPRLFAAVFIFFFGLLAASFFSCAVLLSSVIADIPFPCLVSFSLRTMILIFAHTTVYAS